MRNLLPLISALLLTASCTKKENLGKNDGTIVTTIGMIADVTRQIAGEEQEVINLIGEGIDPHNHKPLKSEVDCIQRAGLVLYNGLLLEGKMSSVLANRRDQGQPIFAVAEGLEGVELLGDHSHPDPHLWMDITIWSQVAETISHHLSTYSPEHKERHTTRLSEYQKKLTDLHAYAQRAFQSIPENQRVLVTAHDAFSYLGRAYGIEVRGIQGISTESEAGTKDINDLVAYLVEKEIPAIFVESSVPEKSVQAVIEGAAQKGHKVKNGGTLFSDAMGSSGSYRGTYIGMMDHNITTIVKALGGDVPETGFQGKL